MAEEGVRDQLAGELVVLSLALEGHPHLPKGQMPKT
jgi:hypothetical protein